MRTKSASEYLDKKYGRLTFADFLWSWRKCEELSQTAFAKQLGISVQNLNDLEKGRRIPSPARAAKIAKKVGVPEMPIVQLALRDILHRDGFNYKVELRPARK